MLNLHRLMGVMALVPIIAAPLRAEEPDGPGAEFFEKKVRPILAEHCWSCHSANAVKLKGGLRADSREGLLAGGDNGSALVPGHPEKSRFIEAITYKNVELQMPKQGKLPDAVIADLTAWVKMGAPWPGKAANVAVTKEDFDLQKRKREHWAWKPIANPQPPRVKDGAWPLADLDRFILDRLEAKGIAAAKPAEAHVLLRRIYFDLVGLPPPIEEVAAFEKEFAANPQTALGRLVDRLLASPQFGERWARHWLDLVRYGESRGHEFDPNIPNAWHYRDYVIRALNTDVPYNQFVTEHVAGDLMPQPRLNPEDEFNESILGTGFWMLGEEVHSPVDLRADEADRYDNRLDVFSKTFLGLTVSCARCHDHKFDAISTKDYYALFGFLRSSNYRLARFDTIAQNTKIGREIARLRAEHRPVLLRAYADAMNPVVNRAAEWLLAARDAGRVGPGEDITSRVEKIAAERKLDARQLAYWTLHVQKAVKTHSDPLHFWARAAESDKFRQADLESLRQLETLAKNVRTNARIVFDYATAKPEDWLPDDSTFGVGPVKPGDILYSNDPAQPIAELYDHAAAVLDPIWRGLRVSGGSQLDPGSLGYQRAGLTIRTPTLPIDTGLVFYLVKGKGRVYASVDSHIMISGPLHGELVRSFNTPDRFQWIMHDLGRYKGQRAHFEFTAESPEFAVAKVAMGSSAPTLTEPPAAWQIALLEKEDPAAAAAALQRRLSQVTTALAKNALRDVDDARLAQWMIQHPELFSVDARALAEVNARFMKEQGQLISQIWAQSRLALAIQDGSAQDEAVFIRGSYKAPGEVVPRRLLEALAGPNPVPSKSGSGRLELARQMVDPAVNPFITRVIVNRVWHHLFGKGIVGSTDNFGVLGERPTHPELLDHLSVQFVRDGWSLKKLIRSVILSRTYQMSSHPGPAADAADPENLLLHRMRLRRLEGEAIRDAMLSVSGRLNPKMYGPSVLVALTPFLDGRGRPASGPVDGDGRRSVYLAVRRNFLSPMMLAFDTPSPFSTVGKRTVSNVPAQALIMMNDPFVHLMAENWARKLATAPGKAAEKINQIYLAAFSRAPSDTELADCLSFLDAQANSIKAWKDLAHVIFNVKEFLFVE